MGTFITLKTKSFLFLRNTILTFLCLGLVQMSQAQTSGTQCFVKSSDPNRVNAKVTWTYNSTAQTYTIRTTFSKGFVDNTYGTNAIGWPNNHNFSDLVGSDHLQLALYDGSNTKKLEFKIDYISASSSASSGYKSLGVTGGDGKMIVGSSSDIVSWETSLDANFNDYGYVLTSNSPATDASYSTNPSYPNWIYEVWYEVTVKASAFGAAGFGTPSISGVHASPSKTGNNTELVVPGTCPGMMKIGNNVFADANFNGKKDAGEAGLSGVSVKLYKDFNGDNVVDGAAVATTMTDASGNYYFSGLEEGKYIVGVVKASGYAMSASVVSSGSPDNNIDNDNNGVVDAGSEVRTKYMTLSSNAEPTTDGDDASGNMTMDIGLREISNTPTGTSTSGEICWKSTTSGSCVTARTVYTINSNSTVTIRTYLSKCFVDNTYGVNSIGWPKEHTFRSLVYSDNLEYALYNGAGQKVMDFHMDYITASPTASSGYATLGVTGGDGQMVLGNASDVVDVNTSIDVNFNDYGYVLTENSPATDANYTPNPAYPNWIYDVWYEATVKLSAFGPSGFGTVSIPYVHASPSKTGNESEIITKTTCPAVLKLGNLVFNDTNNNGVYDAGEPGIGGATVKLYADANGDNIADGSVIATTTTSATGAYSFSGLAMGCYIVGVTLPQGYIMGSSTSTSATPNNNIDNDNNFIVAAAGEVRTNSICLATGSEPTNDGDDNNGNLTLDAGLKVPPPPPSLTLGNLVFNDVNNNGMWDSGEPGCKALP
jgi:hypothetical protein